MPDIFHIADPEAWSQPQATYAPAAFAAEGFIHCCTDQQIQTVIRNHFPGHSGLLLLRIDLEAVRAEIRYEPGTGGEHYPHIYGPLNRDAVALGNTILLTASADDCVHLLFR